MCRRIAYLLRVVLSIAATAAGKRVSECFIMPRGTPIRTPKLEKLGNEDPAEGLTNYGVMSPKYLNMDD